MNVLVLTGAGISAESGIPTFRDQGGLWEGYRAEDVATPQAFARHPELVQAFYNFRRRNLLDPKIQPNAAHHALAAFEAGFNAGQGEFDRGEFLAAGRNPHAGAPSVRAQGAPVAGAPRGERIVRRAGAGQGSCEARGREPGGDTESDPDEA